MARRFHFDHAALHRRRKHRDARKKRRHAQRSDDAPALRHGQPRGDGTEQHQHELARACVDREEHRRREEERAGP
jgi:hypothetical protein